MSRQKEHPYLQKRTGEKSQSDITVKLTIYDVPESLFIEYAKEVVQPYYPEGISVAIKDLMQKAVEKVENGKFF